VVKEVHSYRIVANISSLTSHYSLEMLPVQIF